MNLEYMKVSQSAILMGKLDKLRRPISLTNPSNVSIYFPKYLSMTLKYTTHFKLVVVHRKKGYFFNYWAGHSVTISVVDRILKKKGEVIKRGISLKRKGRTVKRRMFPLYTARTVTGDRYKLTVNKLSSLKV